MVIVRYSLANQPEHALPIKNLITMFFSVCKRGESRQKEPRVCVHFSQ